MYFLLLLENPDLFDRTNQCVIYTKNTSWPAEICFVQFKVRRTSVHVLQTCVSNFKTLSDVRVLVYVKQVCYLPLVS